MKYSMKGLPVVTELVDDFTAKLKGRLVVFNQILGKQKYMAGDEFSLVDIFYLPYTAKLYQIGLGGLIDEQPNVKAWWETVSNRESWKKVTAPA
jgi:glutathione S-transferase